MHILLTFSFRIQRICGTIFYKEFELYYLTVCYNALSAFHFQKAKPKHDSEVILITDNIIWNTMHITQDSSGFRGASISLLFMCHLRLIVKGHIQTHRKNMYCLIYISREQHFNVRYVIWGSGCVNLNCISDSVQQRSAENRIIISLPTVLPKS